MSLTGVSGKPSYRSNNALGFILCATALTAIELYLEPLADLQSCALCTLVRLLLVAMAGVFLVGFIVNRSMLLQRLLAIVNLTLISTGLITIVMHLLASGTDSQACQLSTAELLSNLGSIDSTMVTLNNAVNCPKLNWNFYDLSFAHLALILLLVLLITTWKILIKKTQRQLFF